MLVYVTAYEDMPLGSPYMDWEPRPGVWHSVVDGEVIYRGKYPHFGACRALIKAGYDPETKVITKTRSGTVVFNSTLARLSALSAEEVNSGVRPPTLRPYRERPKESIPARNREAS